MAEHIDWDSMLSKVKLEDDSVGEIKPILKPCPFCGAEYKLNGDILKYGCSGKEWMHRRNGCILGGFLIKEKDIEAWDRRANDGHS